MSLFEARQALAELEQAAKEKSTHRDVMKRAARSLREMMHREETAQALAQAMRAFLAEHE